MLLETCNVTGSTPLVLLGVNGRVIRRDRNHYTGSQYSPALLCMSTGLIRSWHAEKGGVAAVNGHIGVLRLRRETRRGAVGLISTRRGQRRHGCDKPCTLSRAMSQPGEALK